MSVSLLDTYMIAYPVLVVKPFLEKFLIFFRLFLGLAFGVFVPLVSIILTDILQNARVNIAQNARAGFVQFAGGGAIAHNRQAVKSRQYFLYIAPGVQFGNKKLQKVTNGFL